MAKIMRFAPVVLKNLFSKPVTTKYPAEPIHFPEGSRGHIEIEFDKCILCGLCAMNCPSGAIKVNKAQYTWSIDRFNCVQCGYCTQKCAKKCLHIVPGYQTPDFEKHAVTMKWDDARIQADKDKKAAIAAKALAAKKAREAAAKKKAEAAAKPVTGAVKPVVRAAEPAAGAVKTVAKAAENAGTKSGAAAAKPGTVKPDAAKPQG